MKIFNVTQWKYKLQVEHVACSELLRSATQQPPATIVAERVWRFNNVTANTLNAVTIILFA